jgi:alpha-ketoglutarate-dependent taurine dioxygenase
MTARMTCEPNSVLIWDNRTTAHYAIADYGGFRREMYRLAVTGEKPE